MKVGDAVWARIRTNEAVPPAKMLWARASVTKVNNRADTLDVCFDDDPRADGRAISTWHVIHVADWKFAGTKDPNKAATVRRRA